MNDQSWTQPLEIGHDPRLSVSADDFRAQFEMLQAILDRIGVAVARFERQVAPKVDAFNQAIREAGLGAVGV
jgi:hypothetical protein